jgi:WD40 repeat protein
MWDAAGGAPLASLPTGETVELRSMALSPDGGTVVAGSDGGMVWVWDRPTGRVRPSLFVSATARAYQQRVVQRSKSLPRFLRVTPNYKEHVEAVAVSPDGRLLATASEDNADDGILTGRRPRERMPFIVRLWELETGRLHRSLAGIFTNVAGLAFSPDGTGLAANDGPAVLLCDVATGEWKQRLAGHSGDVTCLAWAADGSVLASGGQDGQLRLWDAAGGQERARLTGHAGAVHGVAFAPDSRTIASGGADGTVRLWSLAGSCELAALHAHHGRVRCVCFSADGETLATGGEDASGAGEVYLWRAPRPKEVRGP